MSEGLVIEVTELGPVKVLELSGPFDATGAAQLRELALKLIAQGSVRLVCDLLEADSIDGFALSTLVSLYRRLKQHHGSLVLAGMTPAVRQLLDNTCLTRVLPMHFDRGEAARAALQ